MDDAIGEGAHAPHMLQAEERWYVVQTQPHAENKAIFHLERQDFRLFCPRTLKTVRHARKTRQVLSPLFPNYLFLAMDIEQTQWRCINGTYGVSHLIMQGERPKPVPSGVVEAIGARIGENGAVDWSKTFKIGQKVRITGGAFADLVGTLEHLDARGRVQLLLEVMGGVSVTLSASDLSPGA